MSHTPGPWQVGIGTLTAFVVPERPIIVAAPNEASRYLGEIRSVAMLGDDADPEPYRSSTYADAYLIAAAPDLLETSQTILALVQDAETYLYLHSNEMQEAVKRLKEAISKADGRVVLGASE